MRSKRTSKHPAISIEIPSSNTSTNKTATAAQPGARPPVKNSYLRVALLCKSGNLEKVIFDRRSNGNQQLI